MNEFIGTANTVLELLDLILTVKGKANYEMGEEAVVEFEKDEIDVSVDVFYDKQNNIIYIR